MSLRHESRIKCACGERFEDIEDLWAHQAERTHEDKGEAWNL